MKNQWLLKFLFVFILLSVLVPVSGCLDTMNNIRQYIESKRSGTSREDYKLDSSSLTIPESSDTVLDIYDKKPPASSNIGSGFNLSTKYSYRHFYENSTGILKMSVRNNGKNPAFIYKYGIAYLETDKWTPLNTGITLQPDEEKTCRVT